MWQSIILGFMGATVWDWVWHILGIFLAVYITVPGLWWKHVERYMQKKREKEELVRQQTLANQEAAKQDHMHVQQEQQPVQNS